MSDAAKPSHLELLNQLPLIRAVDELEEYHRGTYEASDAGQHGGQSNQFEDQIRALFAVLGSTRSIPHKCDGVVTAISDLASRYEESQVYGGLVPGPNQLACYKPDFMAALRTTYVMVQRARSAFSTLDSDATPNPRDLWDELESDKTARPRYFAGQYGVLKDGLWSGPFHLPSGGVNHAAIRKELTEPGSVIGPDWIHPSKAAMSESLVSGVDAVAALAVMTSKYGSRERMTSDSIEKLLRDGAYVEQIMRVKDCTEQEIVAVAEQHGLSVVRKPTSNEMNEYEVPLAPREGDDLTVYDDELIVPKPGQSEPMSPDDRENASIEASEAAAAQFAEAQQKAVEIYKANPSLSNLEILQELSNQGHIVAEPVLERALRPLRSQQQPQQ